MNFRRPSLSYRLIRSVVALSWCGGSVLLMALSPVAPGQVQQPPSPSASHGHALPGLNDSEAAPIDPNRLEHMREDERRKRLLADTAKLVALSNELNDEVSKTSRDELSLEVVRKAEAIEKLAHDVKEHMKS